MKLNLPRRETVEQTGATDPVLYHYRPLMRTFLNKRLEMVLRLMGGLRVDRLLDSGCGGGIFLPELSRRCAHLYAIDVHDRLDAVRAMAARNGIAAEIRQASVTDTSFPDEFFDAVVVVSVLEFLPDPGRALDELRRITKRGGDLFIGFPGANPLVDLGYAWLRASPASAVHRSTHRDIRREAARRFALKQEIRFPELLSAATALYFAVHCVRQG